MNIEQERADFEAWFTKATAYVSDPKDIFAQIVRDTAWVAWQARAARQSQSMPPEISRDLLGKIVDEVFDGAIEDAGVIEDIYRVVARECALQSQDREDDPLQPAANWLIQAIESCTVADIQGRLSIGYNRAQRLFDHATQSRDRANAEWMTCKSRRPWAANTLRERAKDLRSAEKRCRDAFKKDFMGEPARYVADAFGEAAAVFEVRLEAIDHARRAEGEA